MRPKQPKAETARIVDRIVESAPEALAAPQQTDKDRAATTVAGDVSNAFRRKTVVYGDPVIHEELTVEQAKQMSADMDVVFLAIDQSQPDEDDTDIPRETLMPLNPHFTGVAFELKAPANEFFQKPEPVVLPQSLPVYRWEIPLDSMPGYVLPVEITEAQSVDHAREAALAITIGGDEAAENPGRELTHMEKAWIKYSDPMVVKDTTQITMGHFNALYHNQKLKADHDEVERAKRILAEYGIDFAHPEIWVKDQMESITTLAAQSAEREKYDRLQLCHSVENAIDALRIVAQQTGHARPEPVAAPEPDYSDITVVAPAGMKERFPRLVSANWTEHTPFDEADDDERAAFHILFNENDGLAYEWMRGPGASFHTIGQMTKALARLKSLIGPLEGAL